MTQPTQPTQVIHDPDNDTIAYTRPPKPTWREQAEHYITSIRDWYDTWLPRIGSALLLLWLTTTYHR